MKNKKGSKKESYEERKNEKELFHRKCNLFIKISPIYR
jgi:hypothetical protein